MNHITEENPQAKLKAEKPPQMYLSLEAGIFFFFFLKFFNIFSFYEFVYMTQLIVYNFFSDMVELLADHQVHRAVNTPVELLDLQLLVPQDVINEIFLLFLPISSRIQDRKMKFLRLLQQKSKFNAAI